MAVPSAKELLAAACHFGHPRAKWNPRMEPFLYGVHKGIHIFDLEKTREQLERACDELKKLQAEGKTILFVSTKQQSIPMVEAIGEVLGQPTVTKKWMAGLLTNWRTLKKRINYYLDLQKSFQTGEVGKYTKKEQVALRKNLAKLDTALSGVSGMSSPPDALFVVDAVRDHVAVREACKLKIPVYGICDSNADPADFTVPIPANDDAVQSITIILGTIQQELGRQGRGKEKNMEKETEESKETSVPTGPN